jgi:hypothetical protein
MAVHGHGHEFQVVAVGLLQKDQGIVKRQISPVLAQFSLHIIDEQLKVLHIARDCARHNGRGLGLKICHSRHYLKSFRFPRSTI